MNTTPQEITVVVPALDAPQRLDKYLSLLAEPDLSRAYIQGLIAEKLVMVDGRSAAKSLKLTGGETVVMILRPRGMPDMMPEDIPLDIVYDDDYLAVVNKPAGLVVHPAPGNPRHTLVNALLHRFASLADDDGGFRPGIIHRLDKDTSGLLVVAKDDITARKLREQFSERRVEKIYLAIVCGHLPERQGVINLPIGRSLKDRKKMTVTNRGSREAITHYRVTQDYRLNQLVELRLETGRTHQIRVHLSHLNRSVLGDPDYGGRQRWLRGIDPSLRQAATYILSLIRRQALHAKALSFDHPKTGERLSLSCEVPEDMAAVIAELDRRYRI